MMKSSNVHTKGEFLDLTIGLGCLNTEEVGTRLTSKVIDTVDITMRFLDINEGVRRALRHVRVKKPTSSGSANPPD